MTSSVTALYRKLLRLSCSLPTATRLAIRQEIQTAFRTETKMPTQEL